MKIKSIKKFELINYTDKKDGFKKSMLKAVVRFENGMFQEVLLGEKDLFFAVKNKLEFKK